MKKEETVLTAIGLGRKREARYASASELWKKLQIRDASRLDLRTTAGGRGPVAPSLGKCQVLLTFGQQGYS